MSAVVVDTMVVSYIFKRKPLAGRYRPHLDGQTPVVSFMTVAELYEGALRDRWGAEKLARLERALRRYVIVPSSDRLARTFARVREERRHRTISVGDAWIAATAMDLGVPLVTHDRGFGGISDLEVISELDAPGA